MSMNLIFVIWICVLLAGMPIYTSLGLASVLHILTSPTLSPFVVPQKVVMAANSFPLLAIPFFILMGNIMNTSGVTGRIFNFANALVGWMRGGLGHANVVASVIFAGMSGSSVADAGGLGQIEIDAMRRGGYDDDFTCAVTAASSTVGPIIPPSLPMIIYAVLAEASIGGLFLGGVLPGLCMAGGMMFMVRHYAIKRDYPYSPMPTLGSLWTSFRQAFWAILTPIILLMGIFWGIFTPTESAVIAAFYALFLGLFVYRELKFRDIPRAILATNESTGVILALIMTAALFAWDLSIAQVPQTIGRYLDDLTLSPVLLVIGINIFLLFVGCFMESTAAMMILVPILFPIAEKVGMSSIQFGVMIVLNLMIGTVTPPIGVVLFVTSNVAKVPFDRVARATLPFLVPLIVTLLLIAVWPPFTTWLPWAIMAVK
ncbi:MAG: TRAP transporter large permease [Planctomycetota bacterium]|jgi:tripartite ATP-independent transporter DctM subunit|nr:TRAP transporter large permease [Planctomycetota bacterium]